LELPPSLRASDILYLQPFFSPLDWDLTIWIVALLKAVELRATSNRLTIPLQYLKKRDMKHYCCFNRLLVISPYLKVLSNHLKFTISLKCRRSTPSLLYIL
jgi:hypothetical protein